MNTISARKQEDDWKTERDLDTMLEAERIEKDPKRKARVAKLAKERMVALGGVAAEAAPDAS